MGRLPVLAALAVVAAACASPAEVAGGCVPDGQVPLLVADAPVWSDPPAWEELWRAGGTRAGEPLIHPAGVAVGPDGRLAIADFQLGEVVVVGPDGGWEGTWTEPGDGPGEVRLPVAAAWRAAGELAVFDIARSRIVHRGVQGRLRDDEPVSAEATGPVLAAGTLEGAALARDGTVLLLPGPVQVAGGEGSTLRAAVLRIPPAGRADTLVRAEVPALGGIFSQLPAPGWSRPVAVLAPDGRIYLGGEDDRYRVRVLAPDGRPVRDLCRPVDPLPLSGAERGEVGEVGATAPVGAIRRAPEPEVPAPFGRLVAARDGSLWVQRERPAPLDPQDGSWGVPGARHDVFDPEGRWLGEVRAPGGARVQAVAGDTVWAFEVGELDEVWVVAYRLRREG